MNALQQALEQKVSKRFANHYLHHQEFNMLSTQVGGDECAYLLWMLKLNCICSCLKRHGVRYIARTVDMLKSEMLLSEYKLEIYLKRLKELGRIELFNDYYKNHKMTHIRVLDCPTFYLDHKAVKAAARRLGSIEIAFQYFSLENMFRISEIEINEEKWFTRSRMELMKLWGLNSRRTVDERLTLFIKEGLLESKLNLWNKKQQMHYRIPENVLDVFKIEPSSKSYPQPKGENCTPTGAKFALSYNNILKKKDIKINKTPREAIYFAHAKNYGLGSRKEWTDRHTENLKQRIKQNSKISNPVEAFAWLKFSIHNKMKAGMSYEHASNQMLKIVRDGRYSKPFGFDKHSDTAPRIIHESSPNCGGVLPEYPEQEVSSVLSVSGAGNPKTVAIVASPIVIKDWMASFCNRDKNIKIEQPVIEETMKTDSGPQYIKPKMQVLEERLDEYRRKIAECKDQLRIKAYQTMLMSIQKQISDIRDVRRR